MHCKNAESFKKMKQLESVPVKNNIGIYKVGKETDYIRHAER